MQALPEHWSPLEVYEDTVDLGGLSIRRAGLSSTGPAGEATGSASELATDPRPRAQYELLERIGILEAIHGGEAHVSRDEDGASLVTMAHDRIFLQSDEPASWRPARSNGIALHGSWRAACFHAKAELVERDRVLRAWAGNIRPEPIRFRAEHVRPLDGAGYTWSAFAFPAEAGSFGAELAVAGVFGIPDDEALPLAVGYCARPKHEDALAGALREATQMLSFLWGEPVATVEPALTPTALFHLEALQVPHRRSLLLRWLDGGHAIHRSNVGSSVGDASVRYVDLTPTWMVGGWRIAKAMCSRAIPLSFGRDPFFRNLPAELQIHPVA